MEKEMGQKNLILVGFGDEDKDEFFSLRIGTG